MKNNDPFVVDDSSQNDFLKEQQLLISKLRYDQLGKDLLFDQSNVKWPIELLLLLTLKEYDQQQPVQMGVHQCYLDLKKKFNLAGLTTNASMQKVSTNAFYIYFASLPEETREIIINQMLIAVTKGEVIQPKSCRTHPKCCITHPLCHLIEEIKKISTIELTLKISLLEDFLSREHRQAVKKIIQIVEFSIENISLVLGLVRNFEKKELILAKQCYRTMLKKIGSFDGKDAKIRREIIEMYFFQLIQFQINEINEALSSNKGQHKLFKNAIEEIKADLDLFDFKTKQSLNTLLSSLVEQQEVVVINIKESSYQETKNEFNLKDYLASSLMFVSKFKSKQNCFSSVNILFFDPDGAFEDSFDQDDLKNTGPKINFEKIKLPFNPLEENQASADALVIAIDFYYEQSPIVELMHKIPKVYSASTQFLVFVKNCEFTAKENLQIAEIQSVFPKAISHYTKMLSVDFLNFVVSQIDQPQQNSTSLNSH